MGCVFKILTGPQWAELQHSGAFSGSPADLADGYIHLSTAAQTPGTLAKHYAGQQGLVLLAVDLEAAGGALRWEPARGGELFPHLYAALPLAAVRAWGDITGDADGRCQPPTEVLQWG